MTNLPLDQPLNADTTNEMRHLTDSKDWEWWGSAWKPLKRSRWLELREDALRRISADLFGEDEHGNANVMLKLQARANHSNFGLCPGCQASTERWLAIRRDHKQYTPAELRALKKEIFAHALLIRDIRTAINKWFIDSAGRHELSAEVDDKCGSQYMYFPIAKGGRDPMPSKWQYRFSLQNNLFPNSLLRMSLVPPCLGTGANFGGSALLSAMHELATDDAEKLGKPLGKEFFRLTDGGSDNDAIVTHLLNWLLVHLGVFQKLVWGRGRPKHSHNFADRANSMIKQVVWPRSGAVTEGGCNAPFDFKNVVQKALKTQKGTPQVAWQLTNYDLAKWFEEFFKWKAEDISEYRYWEYNYVSDMPTHVVADTAHAVALQLTSH